LNAVPDGASIKKRAAGADNAALPRNSHKPTAAEIATSAVVAGHNQRVRPDRSRTSGASELMSDIASPMSRNRRRGSFSRQRSSSR